MTVRQINLSDKELADRLYEAVGNFDPFMKPLIAARIVGHREGDEGSTEWIRKALGWDT